MVFIEDKYTIGASYILDNGKFLNVYSNREITECKGTLHHSLLKDKLRKNEEIISLIDKAIIINDGSSFEWECAYACVQHKMTTAQEKSLIDFLYKLMEKKIKNVSISTSEKDIFTEKMKTFDFLSPDNESGYLPEEILKEIKKLKGDSNYGRKENKRRII